MTTFYDHKNRPHQLISLDIGFTYLYSLCDNSLVKIANHYFGIIFKERPNAAGTNS